MLLLLLLLSISEDILNILDLIKWSKDSMVILEKDKIH